MIIVSQTRANLGFGAQFKPKTRFGGNALDFYCSQIMWLSVIESLKKKGRKVGTRVQVKVTKNKSSGKERTVNFIILNDYGIDDLTSMVEFLVEEKFWKKKADDEEERPNKKGRKKKNIIITEDPFIDGKVEEIVDHIEENNLEDNLIQVVK